MRILQRILHPKTVPAVNAVELTRAILYAVTIIDVDIFNREGTDVDDDTKIKLVELQKRLLKAFRSYGVIE